MAALILHLCVFPFVRASALPKAYRYLTRGATTTSTTGAAAPLDLEAARGGEEEEEEDPSSSESVNLMLLGPTRPLPFFTDLPPPRLEDRRIFVTTFNCGECTLESFADKLGDWIPKRDVAVYVSPTRCMVGVCS